MSNAKFTKGLWVADYDKSLTRYSEGSIYCGDFHLSIITGANYQCTFGGISRDWGKNYEIEDDNEHKANAQLMAVAPEMYAEIQTDLNRLISSIGCFTGHHRQQIKKEIKRKEKLLAKARGES
jgi:hypothetical protein